MPRLGLRPQECERCFAGAERERRALTRVHRQDELNGSFYRTLDIRFHENIVVLGVESAHVGWTEWILILHLLYQSSWKSFGGSKVLSNDIMLGLHVANGVDNHLRLTKCCDSSKPSIVLILTDLSSGIGSSFSLSPVWVLQTLYVTPNPMVISKSCGYLG